jgi:hypothetical protein
MHEKEILSVLCIKQFDIFIKNIKSNKPTVMIPKNCQTFHYFIPKRYINTIKDGKRIFNPFYCQCFYFAYNGQINTMLSTSNKNNDIKIRLKLNNTSDVYVIDIYEADLYINNLKKKYSLLMDDQMVEYYSLMARTFKNIEDPSYNLRKYIKPVYLIQRPINFDNEIIDIDDLNNIDFNNNCFTF